MPDEFEEAQQKALEEARDRQTASVTDRLGQLRTRLEDVEHNQLVLEETIKELTPTDDLETVKMRLNQVISTINKLAL